MNTNEPTSRLHRRFIWGVSARNHSSRCSAQWQSSNARVNINGVANPHRRHYRIMTRRWARPQKILNLTQDDLDDIMSTTDDSLGVETTESVFERISTSSRRTTNSRRSTRMRRFGRKWRNYFCLKKNSPRNCWNCSVENWTKFKRRIDDWPCCDRLRSEFLLCNTSRCISFYLNLAWWTTVSLRISFWFFISSH